MALMLVAVVVRYRTKGMLGCGGANTDGLDKYAFILSSASWNS